MSGRGTLPRHGLPSHGPQPAALLLPQRSPLLLPRLSSRKRDGQRQDHPNLLCSHLMLLLLYFRRRDGQRQDHPDFPDSGGGGACRGRADWRDAAAPRGEAAVKRFGVQHICNVAGCEVENHARRSGSPGVDCGRCAGPHVPRLPGTPVNAGCRHRGAAGGMGEESGAGPGGETAAVACWLLVLCLAAAACCCTVTDNNRRLLATCGLLGQPWIRTALNAQPISTGCSR